jgi:thioredoxin-related protein
MNLRLLLIYFIIFIAAPSFSQNKIKWNAWETLAEKMNFGDRKFIVYLYYDGCKWCRLMEESTFSNDGIAKFVNQKFYTYKLNAQYSGKIVVADKTFTNEKLSKFEFHELAINLLGGDMSFPSVVFLDEKFNKLVHFDSAINAEDFEMILSYYGGDYYKKVLWKRYASNYCKDRHFSTLVKN